MDSEPVKLDFMLFPYMLRTASFVLYILAGDTFSDTSSRNSKVKRRTQVAVTAEWQENTSNMRKLGTFLMACIIVGLLQVKCTALCYLQCIRSSNMWGSGISNSHVSQCLTCVAFVTNFRKLKRMEVTILGNVCVSCYIYCWTWLNRYNKHTHTNTQARTNKRTLRNKITYVYTNS
jgi:hypothetical protein